MSIKDKYTIKTIPYEQTKEWLLYKHYAHRIPSISYAFGLYKENILEGICTFGKPASNQLCEGVAGKENKSIVYELNRLCVNEDLEKNVLSYFVSKSIKELPKPMIIISYADEGQGHHGYIYQATNWVYTGRTKPRTDIDSGEGKHSRHYDKAIDYSKNRKDRTPKHRYIMLWGYKGKINYKTKQYPKGDNQRYNASYQPATQQILI